jgi:hypothetical protein
LRDTDGTFTGWYVNLEEPAARWRDAGLAGVDIVDQDLDIVIGPDHVAEWKDEDEFTTRLAFGDRYWVIAAAARGDFPFDGSWCDFAPPASWSTPRALPDGCLRPPRR